MAFSFFVLKMAHMKRKKKDTPDRVELSEQEVSVLIKRIKSNNLDESSKELIIKSLQGMLWLSKMLQAKKLSIMRLARLFGIKTEKQKRRSGDEKKDNGNNKGKEKKKGHGRNDERKYPGANRVFHEHKELCKGDKCPLCLRGTLYNLALGTFMSVKGSSPLSATVHKVERLRCSGCGHIYTAETPKEVGKQKYDETADVSIALMKYGTGVPFYRQENWQKLLGIALPSSTQWDRVENLASSLYMVYEELIKEAGKGKLCHVDDTSVKITLLRKELLKQVGRKKRMGIFTTGLISKSGKRIINLFFSGRNHAGENMDRVLRQRPKGLPLMIEMSDALSRNIPKEHLTLSCLCLTHARRNFIDAKVESTIMCDYVLKQLGRIYFNDKVAKSRGMNSEERLRWHQKKSGRILMGLRRWGLKKFATKKIEVNAPLGGAIKYLLNNWKGLTEFLRTPGVPLDNSAAERLLKRAILHRKNSLFYRTILGAYVGDVIMSLVETSRSCGGNPFEYLVALHRNRDIVRKAPSKFFPWNYQENLPV